MPSIKLEGVQVEFPIYDGRARSLRNRIFSSLKSERIDVEKAGRVVVRGLIDVNLNVNPGDRVGIIGRNGSGKSTLLRVLAGIYEPASGLVQVNGTIAALLDMVLGMDMDSTGYENMVLRGLALGLSRAEIREVEAEVAEFSGLGGHLHLPAQTYSSGMTLRLAFAISTARTREILLIDEVIGAGDAEFLKKARRRMNELAARSSIVLVASHNSAALLDMCDTGLVMDGGRIRFNGPIDEALAFYRDEVQANVPKAYPPQQHDRPPPQVQAPPAASDPPSKDTAGREPKPEISGAPKRRSGGMA